MDKKLPEYQSWKQTKRIEGNYGKQTLTDAALVEREVASNHLYGLVPFGQRTYGQVPQAYVTCTCRSICNKEGKAPQVHPPKKMTEEQESS
jgi:hypothetical protein